MSTFTCPGCDYTYEGNPLLHAVVSASHGADNDLLPLLTTRSQALIETAEQVVGDRVSGYELPLPDRERDAVIDLVVRTVLNHVMQPGGGPQVIADGIAGVVERLLRTSG